MKRYKVAVIEDDWQLLPAFVDSLKQNGFDVQGYDEAEKFLAETFGTLFPRPEIPDVVLIDLKLKPRKMQGIALVADLVGRKNFDSAIMVMSGNTTSEHMVEAIKLGASAGVPKPFDSNSAVGTLQRLAELTRRRRVYKLRENAGAIEPDSSRLYRQVFLSYSGRDDVLANGIRRNIEARGISVWYAPTTIPPGDPWKLRVEAGINNANVFVALLSDNYILHSRHCPKELEQFELRVAQAAEPKPLVLPVVLGLSSRAEKGGLFQQVQKYQCIYISDGFIDSLSALLLRIETYLGRLTTSRKARPKAAVTISDKVYTFPSHSEDSFS